MLQPKPPDAAAERRPVRHCNGAARSFGEKEKFLTSAYKKKLIEDQKWDEEMRRCYQPSPTAGAFFGARVPAVPRRTFALCSVACGGAPRPSAPAAAAALSARRCFRRSQCALVPARLASP
jgi:hypothetical protein